MLAEKYASFQSYQAEHVLRLLAQEPAWSPSDSFGSLDMSWVNTEVPFIRETFSEAAAERWQIRAQGLRRRIVYWCWRRCAIERCIQAPR